MSAKLRISASDAALSGSLPAGAVPLVAVLLVALATAIDRAEAIRGLAANAGPGVAVASGGGF